jgi:hypothetical protein
VPRGMAILAMLCRLRRVRQTPGGKENEANRTKLSSYNNLDKYDARRSQSTYEYYYQ